MCVYVCVLVWVNVCGCTRFCTWRLGFHFVPATNDLTSIYDPDFCTNTSSYGNPDKTSIINCYPSAFLPALHCCLCMNIHFHFETFNPSCLQHSQNGVLRVPRKKTN